MKRILLIILGASMLLYSEFSRDDNGIITDSITGLVWQDNETVEKSWVEAISYCEALTLGGNDDWRLPNKKELLSIVDYTTTHPALSSAFQNTNSGDGSFWPSYAYWSSTIYAGDNNLHQYAWAVDFYHGFTIGDYRTDNNSVRCIRAGQ